MRMSLSVISSSARSSAAISASSCSPRYASQDLLRDSERDDVVPFRLEGQDVVDLAEHPVPVAGAPCVFGDVAERRDPERALPEAPGEVHRVALEINSEPRIVQGDFEREVLGRGRHEVGPVDLLGQLPRAAVQRTCLPHSALEAVRLALADHRLDDDVGRPDALGRRQDSGRAARDPRRTGQA